MIRDQHVIVAYDITDDQRRRKLFKFLKGFGIRTQYSFFECFLSDVQVVKLRAGLLELIDSQEDRLGIMLLCEHCFDRIVRVGYEEPQIFGSENLII